MMYMMLKVTGACCLVGALAVLLFQAASAAPIPFTETITRDIALELDVTVFGGPITEDADDNATASFTNLNLWTVTVELKPDDGIEDDQLDVTVTVQHQPIAVERHVHPLKGDPFTFDLSIDAEDADANRNVSASTADFKAHGGHFDFYSAVLSGITDPNDAEDELISWNLNIVGTHCAGAAAAAAPSADLQCAIEGVPAPSSLLLLAPSPLLLALLMWRRRQRARNRENL